jgi:hypothetical protein
VRLIAIEAKDGLSETVALDAGTPADEARERRTVRCRDQGV